MSIAGETESLLILVYITVRCPGLDFCPTHLRCANEENGVTNTVCH